MGMLIKQGKEGYTGAALARRRVEMASPRNPDILSPKPKTLRWRWACRSLSSGTIFLSRYLCSSAMDTARFCHCVRNGFHALTISTLVLVKGIKSDRE